MKEFFVILIGKFDRWIFEIDGEEEGFIWYEFIISFIELFKLLIYIYCYFF